MSSTADTGDVVEVSEGGITVRKTFTADEFPVPAIRFEFESDADEPVTVRLAEEIPSSFPMDGVGFHPEYHSDQWTAFEDNRVEFTGTIEPGSSLVTVYGIRIDDETESERFLTEPTFEDVRPAGDAPKDADSPAEPVEDTMIGDIISDDRNQVVKDMLVGASDSVPGLSGADESAGGAEPGVDDTEGGDDPDRDDEFSGEDELGELDLDLGDVDTDPVDVPEEEDDAPDLDIDFGEESVPEAEGEGQSATDVRPEDEPKIELDIEAAVHAEEAADDRSSRGSGDDGRSDSVEENPADATTDSSEKVSTGIPDSSTSVAETLAGEIRRGSVDDDDLAIIAEELGGEVGGPDAARLAHLQSRVEEVAAYAGALETFLDENGTGAQLIESLESDLESFRSDLADVLGRLETTESDVNSLDDQVQSLAGDVDSVGAEVGDLSGDVTRIEDDVESVSNGLDAITDDVEDLDDEVDDLGTDVESLESDVDAVEGDVSSLADDLDSVREDVTDLVEWREQLGSMFSGE